MRTETPVLFKSSWARDSRTISPALPFCFLRGRVSCSSGWPTPQSRDYRPVLPRPAINFSFCTSACNGPNGKGPENRGPSPPIALRAPRDRLEQIWMPSLHSSRAASFHPAPPSSGGPGHPHPPMTSVCERPSQRKRWLNDDLHTLPLLAGGAARQPMAGGGVRCAAG